MQKQIIYKAVEDHLRQRKNAKAGEREWKDVSIKFAWDSSDAVKRCDIINSMTGEKYAFCAIKNKQEILITPSNNMKDGWAEKALYQKLALAIGNFIHYDAVNNEFDVAIENPQGILHLGTFQSANFKSLEGFSNEFSGFNY